MNQAMGKRDAQATLVKQSLAWLLPEPITPNDCVVVRQQGDVAEAAEKPAVLVIGQTGRRLGALPELNRLPARHDFRMVPSIAKPRALLPIGNEQAQFAALLRQRPSSASAVKRLAVAAAPRIPGLARLASSPVHFATVRHSKLFQILHRQALADSLCVSVSNQYSQGRTSIRVLDSQTRTIEVAKFVAHQDGRDLMGTARLEHEHKVLTALQALPALVGSVPVPLYLVRGHLGNTLITDAFRGEPAPPTLSPSMLAWLDRCHFGGEVSIVETTLVKDLIDQTIGHVASDPLLGAAVTRAVENIGARQVPRTVVHGDFVPWNVILVNARPCVFDWEYGCLDGVPGWDEAFFRLRLGYIFAGWPAERVVKEVQELARRPPSSYDPTGYRGVLLLLLVHLVLRDQWEQHDERAVPVKQAIACLLANRWLD